MSRTRKDTLKDAVALAWKIRASWRGENKTPQADPEFWDFLDESSLEMELRQQMLTLNDDGVNRLNQFWKKVVIIMKQCYIQNLIIVQVVT